MKHTTVYLEPTLPLKFEKRIFLYDLINVRGPKLAVIDHQYMSDVNKNSIKPLEQHLEMVMTSKNLRNTETVNRIVKAYLKLNASRRSYVNRQSLTATLLLIGQLNDKQDKSTPLLTLRNLYNMNSAKVHALLDSIEFTGQQANYLDKFSKVIKSNIDDFRSILRFLLQVHRSNVVSKQTRESSLNDEILLLDANDIVANNLYAMLVFNYYLQQIHTLFLDVVATHFLLKNINSDYHYDIYISTTENDDNPIMRQIFYNANRMYSSLLNNQKIILAHSENNINELPTEQEISQYLLSLSFQHRTKCYLGIDQGHLVEFQIDKNQLTSRSFKINQENKSSKRDNLHPNKIENDQQIDPDLASQFGFNDDGGWL